MKGLMFNNSYGLEDAVLSGTKTMTRRNVRIPSTVNGIWVAGFKKWTNSLGDWFTELYDEDERSIEGGRLNPPYEIGEIVSVKQSYRNFSSEYLNTLPNCKELISSNGFNNKMFTKNDIMPHQVKITKIYLQRLQDISDEDCLKEGVIKNQIGYYVKGIKLNSIHGSYTIVDGVEYKLFPTPQEAYAALIDKLGGKGTWDKNEWVWVIEFELNKS